MLPLRRDPLQLRVQRRRRILSQHRTVAMATRRAAITETTAIAN